jgi:hypothetical protein
VRIKQWPQRWKRDSPTSYASKPNRSSPEKNESPRASSTRGSASTPSHINLEATSSTDPCQPWMTTTRSRHHRNCTFQAKQA